MDLILEGIRHAFFLIVALDPEVLEIVWLTLRVSLSAVLIAFLVGLPLGTLLAFGRFRGQDLLRATIYTGMGLPPVVVGLVVALFLWRSGPFGLLNLLYTPAAMILAQTIITTPIVAGLAAAALEGLNPRLRLQLLALGASPVQRVLILWREARRGLLAAGVAAFGRAISEVGAVLIVGGNIKGLTRVLTTAIVLETRTGRFETAIALGLLLLLLSLTINWSLTRIQRRISP